MLRVLTLEEGVAHSMHYGLFERGDESIATAQERSTALLLERLPPPPCRLLEVGVGSARRSRGWPAWATTSRD
ncbi:MAG TPA: hypothetical protein VEO02_07875 [Thermoanaerobaculia bacterium]|nr:hypothetical protein [Thermoanaerobaculia bacterium]